MSQELNSSTAKQPHTINVNIHGVGQSGYTTVTSEKKKTTALILCLLLGVIGGHLFYVGRVTKGILYVFTIGFCGVGVIIDFISILTGSFKDNVGAPLRE